MKSTLTHRVSTAVAATLATAALATGTATADPLAPEPAPISEYGLGADLTALFMALSMSPGSSALNAGSTELASGSGLTRGYMQFLCQLQYGKWDSATATCKYPVFNPSSAVLAPAADATPSPRSATPDPAHR